MAEGSSGTTCNNSENLNKSENSDQSLETVKTKAETVLEPIFLEDTKFNEEPESLRKLLCYFNAHGFSPNQIDILVGLIYILMIESGFVPQGYEGAEDCDFNYKRLLFLSENLPKNWKREGIYSFTFVLSKFYLYECKLACVCTSDDLVINCFVKGIEHCCFNTLLDPLMYFTTSNTQISNMRLQNLNHLSRIFKSEISYPCKSAIFRENNVVFPCLEQLPPEVVIIIMKKLRIKDLCKLSQVNKYFSTLTRELMSKKIKKLK